MRLTYGIVTMSEPNAAHNPAIWMTRVGDQRSDNDPASGRIIRNPIVRVARMMPSCDGVS